MNTPPSAHRWPVITAVLLLFTIFSRGDAALPVYLELTINGEDVTGEPTRTEMGGVDVSAMIECMAFEWETLRSEDSTRAAGRTTIRGLKFVHRLEDCSPLLLDALGRNQRVDGRFLFFRPNTDTGDTEHFYTIEFEQARIVQVRDWVPNTLDPAGASLPPMEEVQIISATVTVTAEGSGNTTTLDTSDPV